MAVVGLAVVPAVGAIAVAQHLADVRHITYRVDRQVAVRYRQHFTDGRREPHIRQGLVIEVHRIAPAYLLLVGQGREVYGLVLALSPSSVCLKVHRIPVISIMVKPRDDILVAVSLFPALVVNGFHRISVHEVRILIIVDILAQGPVIGCRAVIQCVSRNKRDILAYLKISLTSGYSVDAWLISEHAQYCLYASSRALHRLYVVGAQGKPSHEGRVHIGRRNAVEVLVDVATYCHGFSVRGYS